jgi:sugar (pentulose or hexulose) kinase
MTGPTSLEPFWKGLPLLRLIGGGAVSNLWAQIMTDVLRREVLVPEGADAAYGSALIAGVTAGMFAANPEAIGEFISLRMRCKPDERRVALYDELFDIYRQAAQAISDVSHQLHQFQASEY